MIQIVREEKMDYLNFTHAVCNRVREILGEEYQVEIHKVVKNNSLELDSLVILQKGKNFAPNIYLKSYYESYLENTSIQEIAERLCNVYRHHCNPIGNEELLFSLEKMKQRITYRLISFDRNQKLLSQVPHLKYLDLAITFQCLVRDDDNGIGTIRITKEHMKSWKISLEDLSSYAAMNTCRLFPATIKTMKETICGLLTDEIRNYYEYEYCNDIYEPFIAKSFSSDNPPMYVLTNQKGINGATCILYKNLLYHFSNQIQSDFYILPSSVHEVILVPFQDNMKITRLEQMVQEVNRTQVAPEEVLSDRVYYYSREKKGIILL